MRDGWIFSSKASGSKVEIFEPNKVFNLTYLGVTTLAKQGSRHPKRRLKPRWADRNIGEEGNVVTGLPKKRRPTPIGQRWPVRPTQWPCRPPRLCRRKI